MAKRKKGEKGRYVIDHIFSPGKRIWLRDSSIRPRKITPKERAWLIRGLNSLTTGEYVGSHAIDLDTWQKPPLGDPMDPRPYLDQVDNLIVIKKCKCGGKRCHTVTFRQSGEGESVALVEHSTTDNRWLIICVNEKTRELSELEIIG